MTKQQRYRRKCIAEGRCPHCGKQCAPYYECDARRMLRKLLRCLGMAVKSGAVQKLSGGRYRFNGGEWPKGKVSDRPGDRRSLPRIAARPTRAVPIIRHLALVIAKQHGGVVTEEQIAKAYGQMRLTHSKRAKR